MMNHEPMQSLRQPETWFDRLVAERDELQARITKLSDFLFSPASHVLNASAFADLRHQRFCMTEYLEVLNRRINRETRT